MNTTDDRGGDPNAGDFSSPTSGIAAFLQPDRTGDEIDLVNSTFHTAGVVFPERWYRRAWERWRADPLYRASGRGSDAARSAVARYMTRDGLPTSKEQILLTSGASISYELIFRVLVARHRRGRSDCTVALPTPGYPLFEDLARSAGVTPVFYQLDCTRGFVLDPVRITEVLESRPIACVVVSPNNPTGTVYSRDALSRIVTECSRVGTPVISDEVFSAFRREDALLPRAGACAGPRPAAMPRESNGPDASPGPASASRATPEGALTVFTLNGLSKLCAAPEVKLGWIVVHGDQREVTSLVEELDTVHDAYLTVSGYAETAAEEFLSPEAEEDRKRIARDVEFRRGVLEDHLMRIPGVSPCTTPDSSVGGIHRIITVEATHCSAVFGTLHDGSIARMLLRDHGIHLHPGSLYGLTRDVAGTWDPFFVLTCLNTPDTLREGLNRLRRALDSMHNRVYGINGTGQ